MANTKAQVTLLASANRAANGQSVDLDLSPYIEGILYLNVSAHGGTTPTLDVAVQGKDPVSGLYVTIASFTQVTTTDSLTKLIFSRPIPNTIRLNWTIGGSAGPNYTFGVGADLSTE